MSKTRMQSAARRAVGSVLIALVAMAAAGGSTAASSSAASAPMPATRASAAAKPSVPAAPIKVVDVNSASRKELMTLPGIGAAEADKIIANRPYLTKTELVSKAGLPIGPFTALRDRIVARHKGPLPKPKPTP